MGGAAFVHPHGGLGELPGKRPHASGVVEVDVGDHDVGEIAGGQTDGVQPGRNGLHRGGRPRLHQCRLRPVEQIG
jgi:hypothetical protein